MKRNLFCSSVIAMFVAAAIVTLVVSCATEPGTKDAESQLGMIFVEGGEFVMGCTDEQGADCYDNEKPEQTVTVGDFYISKHEVTIGEFREFVEATQYLTDAEKHTDNSIDGLCVVIDEAGRKVKKDSVNWRCDEHGNVRPDDDSDFPVIHVSWNDAAAFCKWKSEQTGVNYRLPMEAEWEYVARGGKSATQQYKYSGSNDINDVAWYKDNSDGRVHKVETKKANALGIFDLSGNVWEWCEDRYSNKSLVEYRTVRGGNWDISARSCRVPSRDFFSPNDQSLFIGFRVAMTKPNDKDKN